jgi:hypothetical protein
VTRPKTQPNELEDFRARSLSGVDEPVSDRSGC